jgi:hypothetical protein
MEIITQKNSQSQVTTNARWAIFCSAFSFTATGIVTVMHLSPMLSDFIIGTKLEGIITIVLAAFWAATVSVGTYNIVVTVLFIIFWGVFLFTIEHHLNITLTLIIIMIN